MAKQAKNKSYKAGLTDAIKILDRFYFGKDEEGEKIEGLPSLQRKLTAASRYKTESAALWNWFKDVKKTILEEGDIEQPQYVTKKKEVEAEVTAEVPSITS
jgi:hypothetical protein